MVAMVQWMDSSISLDNSQDLKSDAEHGGDQETLVPRSADVYPAQATGVSRRREGRFRQGRGYNARRLSAGLEERGALRPPGVRHSASPGGRGRPDIGEASHARWAHEGTGELG